MSARDALLTAMLPRARTLLAERLRRELPVDAGALVQEVLAEFARAVQLDEHAAWLREHLEAALVARLQTL
jgi:hypothetical protein